MPSDKYRCPVCLKDVALTQTGKFRKHNNNSGTECDMAGVIVPEHVRAAGPSDQSEAPVKGRDYADCPACGRTPRLDAEGNYAAHKIVSGGSEQCPFSGRAYEIAGADDDQKSSTQSIAEAEDIEVWRRRRNQRLGKSPELTPTGEASSEQGETLPSNSIPQARGCPPETARTQGSTTNDAPPTPAAAQDLPRSQLDAYRATRADQGPTSTVRLPTMATAPEPAPATESAPASTAPEFRQPAPPFEQPAHTARVLAQAEPMTDLGRDVAARLKETFHAYSNRLPRNTQKALGPSEIGTPCDRRIAMSLLRIPPTNPGGDNWASFIGTAVHAALADMFVWADASTGRYAVEVPLEFPNVYVPRGTGDLLDRTLLMFLDHKLMGRWSLDKLSTKGPSPTYRVQVHTYAYGARLKGEKVDHVAIIGWPREAATLDDLYVWTEPYDPSIAIEALSRVERIAGQVNASEHEPLETARQFPIADDCRFCPFHAPGDSQGERGCNGKQ